MKTRVDSLRYLLVKAITIRVGGYTRKRNEEDIRADEEERERERERRRRRVINVRTGAGEEEDDKANKIQASPNSLLS